MVNVFRRVYNRVNFLFNDYLRKNINNKRFLNIAVNGKEGKLYKKEKLICSITTIPTRIQFVILTEEMIL